jgi:hypothetical protein
MLAGDAMWIISKELPTPDEGIAAAEVLRGM